MDLRRALLQGAKVYDVNVCVLCLLYAIWTVDHHECLNCHAYPIIMVSITWYTDSNFKNCFIKGALYTIPTEQICDPGAFSGYMVGSTTSKCPEN